MCQDRDSQHVIVKIAAHLSSTGQAKLKRVAVDACIAPIVAALQNGGIDMLASCCGHGQAVGRIDLADGRVLLVADGAPQTKPVEGSAVDRHVFCPRCRMPMMPNDSAKPIGGGARMVYSCACCPTSIEDDAVCEHGTALDVHCCNCHSGFIFDINHECEEPESADAVDPQASS